MQALPHRYRVSAQGRDAGPVVLTTAGADALQTHAPPEFDGPQGYWSPESLLVAAVADCYVLSFRAVARASRLEWQQLDVDVEGALDRVDGVTRFTQFRVLPRLRLPAGASETLALRVLQKAHASCLVTNSLNSQCELDPVVESAVEPAPCPT
jgi:organic hydroperoxide reductase OsmC/OhrA